jgi:hypothetical protein
MLQSGGEGQQRGHFMPPQETGQPHTSPAKAHSANTHRSFSTSFFCPASPPLLLPTAHRYGFVEPGNERDRYVMTSLPRLLMEGPLAGSISEEALGRQAPLLSEVSRAPGHRSGGKHAARRGAAWRVQWEGTEGWHGGRSCAGSATRAPSLESARRRWVAALI